MTVLRIEHPVRSYEAWKAAFDTDPIGRERGGVRQHRILRPVDDPATVAIELTFDDPATAELFLGALERLWTTPQARAALAGAPRTRILDVIEDRAS